MAFVDPNAPEQQGQQPGAQAAPQAPVAAGGAGVAGSSKPTPSAPGINVPAQPSAQLSAYLGANQPQTMTLAQNIAGTVGGQVNAANAGIAPAVDTYSGGLYTVPTDAATNSALASSPSSLTPEQQQTFKTELAAASKTPNAANTFETTGAYGDISRAVEDAVSTANLWNAGNNVGSIKTAVAPFEAPNATDGVKTLDALLLSQNPSAYKTITDAVAPAANLRGNLAAGTQRADSSLSTAISTDQGTTAAANAAVQSYAKNLSDYLANAEANAGQTKGKILADINAGNLTPEDISALGMNPEQAQALIQEVQAANAAISAANMGASGVNLSSYLTQTDPTAANVATPTQYADVAALRQLLGASAPVLPISGETAGVAGQNLNQFNYASALQGATTAEQIATLQQQAQSLAAQAQQAIADYKANAANDVHGGIAQGLNQQIAEYNAQIQALNEQITSLSASAPGIFAGNSGVPSAGSGGGSPTDPGALGGTLTDAGSVILPTLGVPIISGIGDLLGDVGGFFGFADGGEVPRRPRSLNEYLGATA